MQVIVIGAGIIGASTAYQLARRGAHVTLIEGARPGGGATHASFSWTNANGKKPASYLALNMAGMAEHAVITGELGNDDWLHVSGNLEWVRPDQLPALEERVAAMQAGGYATEWLDRADVADLEPDLVVPSDVERIAFFPDEGWVEVGPLIADLLAAARSNGAELVRDQVVAIEHVDGQATVTSASGQRWTADRVVNCAGPDGDRIAAMAGQQLPLRTSLGLLAISEPGPVRLTRIIHGNDLYFRPDGLGRVMIAAGGGADHLVEADVTDGPALHQRAQQLIDRTAEMVPGLVGVAPEAARVGRRALPRDGLPVVGALTDEPWLYHVIAHGGITLGPLLGRLATEELLDGTRSTLLNGFEIDRFAS